MTSATLPGTCVVRVLARDDLERALRSEGSERGVGRVLEVPAWAAGDPGWSTLALGWVDAGGDPVAGVLALCRRVPGSARFLAVLTGAPVLREGCEGPPVWLSAATALLRREGAFAVRVAGGPAHPLLTRC